jgi:hypothetical protein
MRTEHGASWSIAAATLPKTIPAAREQVGALLGGCCEQGWDGSRVHKPRLGVRKVGQLAEGILMCLARLGPELFGRASGLVTSMHCDLRVTTVEAPSGSEQTIRLRDSLKAGGAVDSDDDTLEHPQTASQKSGAACESRRARSPMHDVPQTPQSRRL